MFNTVSSASFGEYPDIYANNVIESCVVSSNDPIEHIIGRKCKVKRLCKAKCCVYNAHMYVSGAEAVSDILKYSSNIESIGIQPFSLAFA